MTQRLFCLLFSLSAAACSPISEEEPLGAGGPADFVGDVVPRPHAGCTSNASFDVTAFVEGLDDSLDGKQVWLVAAEPQTFDSSDAASDVAVVRVSEEVEHGAFTLTCANSLSENLNYPSVAVVIDADDSGDCSADDLMARDQRYAWLHDVFVYELTPDRFVVVGNATSWGIPFCDYYFGDD